MRGFLITFEGTEGCGKTTQIALLADRLKTQGKSVTVLREPGGTPIGEEIRHTLKHSLNNHGMTPETELLLINASRAQLVREVLEPARQDGRIILCDRFYDSTIVYQGFGRGLAMDRVRAIIDFAVGETRPDVTFFLDISLKTSEMRRNQRDATHQPQRDRMEEEGRSFFEKVEEGYRTLARLEPGRIRVIDGAQSIQEVHRAIWEEMFKIGILPKN